VPEFNRQGAEDAKGIRNGRFFLLEKHPGVLFLGAVGGLGGSKSGTRTGMRVLK
jgi:hypothetical protein